MLKIAEGDNGHEVTIAKGDELELSLSENPSTGYRWELSGKAAPVCELLNDNFEAAGTMPGRGGMHRWQFRAVQPGSGEIALQYRRSWEEGTPPARSYRVSVRVEK